MKRFIIFVHVALISTSLFALSHWNDNDIMTSVDLQSFYMNGQRDNRADREALSVGGILKLSTKSSDSFGGGVAFYSSHDLLGLGNDADMRYGSLDTSNISGSTDLVQSDGSGIDTLGEPYIEYRFAKSFLRYGRQRVETPLVNGYYNRFLPNTFEALTCSSDLFTKNSIILSWIRKWKYKNEERFKSISEAVGKKSGLFLAGITNHSLKDSEVSLYMYYVPDLFESFYGEFKNDATLSKSWQLKSEFQYLKQKSVGQELLAPIDSYLAGSRFTLLFDDRWFTKVMMTKIGRDTIRGSGTDYANFGYSGYVNYTDIQIDGEALNAKALSYGATAGYRVKEKLNYELKYVKIRQDIDAQLISSTPNKRASSDEYNIDLTQKFSKEFSLRIRFSHIDYKKDALVKNEFDEDNLRVIFHYYFK